MRDLTQGSIARQLFAMALPIAAGMIFQTLYFLIDLYFVGHLGERPLAGVSAAGMVSFIITALTQVLSVGTVALVSQAVGRKDQPEANLIFNQSVVLSAVCGVLTIVCGSALAGPYMHAVAADPATVAAGKTYLYCYLPGLALQFALVAIGSALRGTGIVRPTMLVGMTTVALNAILAPILIGGWVTARPLGVAGAGLATSLSVAVGVIFLWTYFAKLGGYVAFDPAQCRPQWQKLAAILNIGLPAGGELLMVFVIMAVIYSTTRQLGSATQAGIGIGYRVMQAVFLPAMALAFAASPVAGQNFGARQALRVKQTFRTAALFGTYFMVAVTLFCWWQPQALVAIFTHDSEVIGAGAVYLRITAWNFVATGLVFTCSCLFQAMGNTWPSLLSSGLRLLTFVVPAVWLAQQPHFQLRQILYLSVASVTTQAITSLVLLQSQFRRKLDPMPAA